VLIAQMTPPDAFALWKQMKATGYQPQTAFCEKCAAQNAWQRELGPLAEGTTVANFWSPETNAVSAKVAKEFEGEFDNLDLSSVMVSYSAAKVMLDAIEAAGSTEGEAVNEAIGKTDGEYPIGQVKFESDNRYPVPAAAVQWQGANIKQVYPPVAGAKLQAPVKGLG
jgi:ABC-type branched-subunit amino acid transport system substrate-binding protein